MFLLLLACPAPTKDDSLTHSGDETGVESAIPLCGSAGQTLPEGLTELAFDDGEAEGSLADRALSVYGSSTADSPARHGVRFELENPARIHGFKVQWAAGLRLRRAHRSLPSRTDLRRCDAPARRPLAGRGPDRCRE